MVLVGAPSAASAAASSCSAFFPEVAWERVGDTTVELGVAGVPTGQIGRFASEIEASASAIERDIGGLEGAVVCLASPQAGIDTFDYVPATTRFHAILDGPNGLLVLSTERVGSIKPAAAFGLAHLALWDASDGQGWPEPLASAIAQWYRAVALDRLELYHVQAQGIDFTTDPITGEGNYGLNFGTDPIIDWFASTQPPVRVWDPTTNEAPIGDFIEFTVDAEGTEVLLDTDEGAWQQREGAWRTALVADLTGRTTPTTTWRNGVILTVALILVASLIALGGWAAKRRLRRKGSTPAPIPGFFSSDDRT
jgi:hypothetical protein